MMIYQRKSHFSTARGTNSGGFYISKYFETFVFESRGHPKRGLVKSDNLVTDGAGSKNVKILGDVICKCSLYKPFVFMSLCLSKR